jgi:hypothetical protein
MEEVKISLDTLQKLIEVGIQFGVDNPDLVLKSKDKEKIGKWLLDKWMSEGQPK